LSLRILHVLQTADGGGATHALALATHAARHGHEVAIAAPLPGVRGSDCESVILARSPIRRAAAVLGLARSSDLVHAHGARAATWALPALAARPSVVTFHGLHLLRRPAGHAHRVAAHAVLAAISGAADAMICVSNAEAHDLRRLRPGYNKKLHVVQNAVPEQPPVAEGERRAARARLGVPDDGLIVLLLGRLDEQKDPLFAVNVANALQAEGVILVVAGDGALLPSVRAAARENVILLGHRADVRPLLAACDVVINTSRWEGLSLAVLEAMWAGRPVVASAVAGNVEALGDAGILVHPGDVEGFRAAVRSMQNERERERIAELARRRVASEFLLDEMLAATDAVYDAVLRRRSG
jgi:glycosyltransferase involved in cell wall biosynthesis